MYHYTESGLRNVWLTSGYTVDKEDGSVAIQDVEGLHKLIGKMLARRPKLTGSELRFLRKEMELSQRALSALLGTSEQSVSLWERRGSVPKWSNRLVKAIYLEQATGNVKIREMIERHLSLDRDRHNKLTLERDTVWKEAA